MKTDTVLVDFAGATAHFTEQLRAALNKEAVTKTKLITIRPGIDNKKLLVSVVWNRLVRLASIPINYIILFMRALACGPNKIFIFNIPLVPAIEIFFLCLIRIKGGVSVGILHNLIPSHGEKKCFRNYKYFEFYNRCDIVIFHDPSVATNFNNVFPKPFPLFIDLPGYSVPNAVTYTSLSSKRSDVLKLGFMGTVRPYKNLEIVGSEFKGLSDKQLSSVSFKIIGKAFYDIDKLVNGFENLGFGEFLYNKEALSDDDFFREMAECDFLLLPHASSSGSGLLSVAASLGIPVIASNIAVFTDFVHRYENGVIFDHLTAGDLYRVISVLIEDRVERQNLKTRALRAAQSVPTWTNYTNNILACCDTLSKRKIR